MSIAFTQFLRPHGRRQTIAIERPAEVEAQAAQLMGAGARFEIEELMTGMVSIEILADNPKDADEPHSLALELAPNGPQVPNAVDLAVRTALLEAQRLGLPL